MVECKHCSNLCSRISVANHDTCCFCSLLHIEGYCKTCADKHSILTDLKRDMEESKDMILSSGIHYWYKLKYEFNILKYITHNQKDFNKHDKQTLAQMAHDGEFWMGVRSSGTDIVDLDWWLVRIKDIKSHGALQLAKTIKVYFSRDEMFFWGNKGRIAYIPHNQIINTFKSWLKEHDLDTIKVNSILF